ncbi:hypothetical protein GCM10007235_03240 [Pseudoxanthomonas indica]|nr:hypothetical protein GCM10007235_03240 [Pseudoxanthomonas indica]
MLDHAAHQILEVLQIGYFMRLLVGELGNHLVDHAAAYLPGVDRLQRTPARTRAGYGINAIFSDLSAHGFFRL